MDDAVKSDRESVMTETEENQQNVREMVMESYHDMQLGKGRDYKQFFSELESSYDHADLFEITMENDPFYGKSNAKILKESIEQMERHPERNVVKTLKELEQMQ